MIRHSVLIAAAFLFSCSSVMAEQIITTNLPTGSAIINIDGTADGAAAFGGVNADDWYQPFNTNNSLLEYTFQPGTYTFRVVDQTDAAALFPSLTAAQLSSIGGAWTYNSPWTTDWVAFDSSAVTDPTQHQLFTGAVAPNRYGYSSSSLAYESAITGGYYNEIVTGTGRYTGTTVASYTFSSQQTLVFVVPDYYLPDNGGIVSVLISQDPHAVPEPSVLVMGATGFGMLGFLRVLRGKKSRANARLPSERE